MKKFVRGQYVRVLSYAMLILMTIPTLLLPMAKAGHAATGGQQSIVILPFSTTAENAPAKINEQVTQQLITALNKAYQVDRLDSRSSRLKLAINESGDPALATAYKTAVDISADADARMKAAATLAVHLNIDGIIYGDVNGYEVSKSSKTSVRVNATMVTLQRDASGKYLVDPQNNVIPEATPLEGIGNSQLLPNNKATQDLLDSEAISQSVTRIAQQISTVTGKPVSSEANTNTSGNTQKKSSKNRTLLIGVGALALAIVAAGVGKSDTKSATPSITPVSTPQITRIYADIDSTELKPYVYISWNTTDSSDRIAGFYIYRTSQAFSKATPKAIQSTKFPTKFAVGHGSNTDTRNTTTLRRLTPQKPRRIMTSSLASTKTEDYVQYVPGGNSSFYKDYDVAVGQEYSYYIVALANDGKTSQASPVRSQSVTESEGSVDGLTLSLVPGAVKLNWDNTNSMGAGYKIYRSNSIIAGTKYISKAKLSQLTDITVPTIIPLLTTDFNDYSPSFGDLNSYIVIYCDSAGKPVKDGPYNVVQIDVPDRVWNGTIASATVATPATSQKLYYSVDSADQLSDSVTIPTDITFTVTGTPTVPAGALVTITTNIGSLVPKGMGQTLIDSQRIIGTLDSTGTITVKYQGRAEDPNRNAFLPPTLSELGSPTFSIACNNTTISSTAATITGTYPVLVGPPHSITLVKTFANTQTGSIDVLFQNESMTLDATVKDISGQTVLSGMPIWFVQSWDKLDDEQVATIEYFQAVKDWGIVGTSCTYTDGNGVARTDFNSFHSGKYTLHAYALRKNAITNRQMLTDINTNSIGGLTPDVYASVKDYILPMTGDAGDVTSSTDLLCKTYAHYENWHLVSVSNKRISCGNTTPDVPNGDQATTVKYTAEDEDGKRVLPGVFFTMRADRYGINSIDQDASLKVAIIQTATDSDVDPDDSVYFNESGEASFTLRGNGVIGGVRLRFNSQKGAQPHFSTPSPVVFMYGPYLRETDASSIWFASPQINPNVQRIASATDANAANVPNQVVCRVVLKDAQGNPFPAGYYVQISNEVQNAIAWTNGFAETDMNGVCSFTYTGPVLDANSNIDQIRDNFIFTIYGENKEGADVRSTDPTRCTPGYEEFGSKVQKPIIITERPKDNHNLSTISPYTDYLSLNDDTNGFEVTVYTDDNLAIADDYQISWYLEKSYPALDTTLSAKTSMTDDGVAMINLVTGTKVGTVIVYAYYDENGNGRYDASEIIAKTNTIYIGISAPSPAGLILVVNNDNTVDITWDHIVGNRGYNIESSLDGTNFTLLYTAPQDSTTYTDVRFKNKNMGANQKVYYRVIAIGPNGVLSDPSKVGEVTLLPLLGSDIGTLDFALTAVGTSSTNVDLKWKTYANLGITTYEFDRATSIDALNNTAEFSSATSPYSDKDTKLMPGVTYYYRVRAVNAVSASPWSLPVSATLYPGKTTGVTAKAISSTAVTLSWDSMPGVTHYIIERDGAVIFDSASGTTPLSTTYSDAGLKAGTTYKYIVYASNIADPSPLNAGPASDAATVITLPDAPVISTNSFDITIDTQEIKFTWAAVPSAKGYKVSRSIDGIIWKSLNTKVTDTFYDDKAVDLLPATAYRYQVVAFNDSGDSLPSVAGPYTTYPQKVTITVTPTSDRSVRISWLSVRNAKTYYVYKLESGNGEEPLPNNPILTKTPVGTIPAGNVPMEAYDTLSSDFKVGLDTVIYRVVACVGDTEPGSSSDPVKITDFIPAKPVLSSVLPDITKNPNTQLLVTWAKADGATKYNIYSSTTNAANSFTKVNTADVTALQFIHTGLKAGTTYYYKVEAVNSAGTTLSDSMSGYTEPDAVLTPTATVAGKLITLNWAAPVTPVGSQLTYYVYNCAKDGAISGDAYPSTVTTTFTYTGTDAQVGLPIRFKVLATNHTYSEIKAIEAQLPGYTGATNVVTALIFPSNNWVKVTPESNSSLVVAWDKVTGSDGKDATYTIERARASNPTVWTKVTDNDADPLSFTDTNLTGATTYLYRVSYTTVDGTSTWFMAPGAISYPSATTYPDKTLVTLGSVTGSSVSLSWTDTGATAYLVQRSTDNSNWVNLGNPTNLLGCTDNTVTSGSTYYYHVIAYDANGDGVIPADSDSIVALTLPGAGWITLKPNGTDKIDVSWKAISNATGYTVESSTSATGPWKSVLDNKNQITVTDTSLTVATTYFYRVSYTITLGDGTTRTSQGYLEPTALTYPSATTWPNAVNLTIKSLTNEPSTTIPMYWTASQGANQYLIYRGTNGNAPVQIDTWYKLATITDPYIDTNLAEGTPYKYYIVASCDPRGTSEPLGSPSNEVTVTTKPPVPTGCSANGVGYYSVKITWNDVKGETGYRIERREVVKGATPDTLIPITPWQNITMKLPTDPTYELPAGTTSYIENGLKSNTMYQYQIAAFNASGESILQLIPGYAKTVQIIDKPTMSDPTPLTARSVSLSWGAVTNATKYEVQQLIGGVWTKVDTTPNLTYVVTGLTPATTYSFQVIALSETDDKSDPSAEKSVTTFALPNAPILNAITAYTANSATLTWTSDVPAAELKSFSVQRATAQMGPNGWVYDTWTTVAPAVTDTTWTDTTVSVGVVYAYRVSVTNIRDDVSAMSVSQYVLPR